MRADPDITIDETKGLDGWHWYCRDCHDGDSRFATEDDAAEDALNHEMRWHTPGERDYDDDRKEARVA